MSKPIAGLQSTETENYIGPDPEGTGLVLLVFGKAEPFGVEPDDARRIARLLLRAADYVEHIQTARPN